MVQFDAGVPLTNAQHPQREKVKYGTTFVEAHQETLKRKQMHQREKKDYHAVVSQAREAASSFNHSASLQDGPGCNQSRHKAVNSALRCHAYSSFGVPASWKTWPPIARDLLSASTDV